MRELELKKLSVFTHERGENVYCLYSPYLLGAPLHSKQCDEMMAIWRLAGEIAVEQRNYSFSSHSIVKEEREKGKKKY
jgi:hypothetical protein